MLKTLKSLLTTPKGFAAVGIGSVFAIAVYISAQHIVHVAMYFGQTMSEAAALPAILDIFALFCAIRLRLAGISDIARKLARAGMWFTLGTSMLFNLESAIITYTGNAGYEMVWSLFVASIPAVVVWLAAEILTHVRKAGLTSRPATTSTSKPATKGTTAKIAAPRSPRKPSEKILAQKAAETVSAAQ